MELKKDHKYGVVITAKRDLTPEEAEYVHKALDVATSGLNLHLKGSIVTNINKNGDGHESKH